MYISRVLAIGSALLFIGCGVEPTNPLPDDVMLSKAGGGQVSDPSATWYLPLDDAALTFRSDGLYGDDTHSVYAPGVCGSTSTIFATTAKSGSGDATLQTSAPKGKNCGRRFTITYPDGGIDVVHAFLNLNELQSPTFSIAPGTTVTRRFVINPRVVNAASRCGRIMFGNNASNAAPGSDALLVTRVDARTWDVESDPVANQAYCEDLQTTYSMHVRFRIVADHDLP